MIPIWNAVQSRLPINNMPDQVFEMLKLYPQASSHPASVDRLASVRHVSNATSTRSTRPNCPECRKLMRSMAKAAAGEFKFAANGLDDPLHSPEVWNLLESELQPPKAAGEVLSVNKKS